MNKTIFLAMILATISSPLLSRGEEPTVGSHIRELDMEELSPTTIIDRGDIEDSFAETIGELLRDSHLAPYGGSASRVNVRGIGAERTLVLLNGKHLPRTGGSYYTRSTNVNVVPLSAVERIEILTDGASSVYGQDALLVVINIVTIDDVEGLHLSVKPTLGSIKGGETLNGSLTWGKTLSDGHFSTNFDINHGRERFARDKDYINPDSLRQQNNSDNYSTSSNPGLRAFPDCQEKTGDRCTQYHGDVNRTGDSYDVSNYSQFELDLESGMTFTADFLGRYSENSEYVPAAYRWLNLDSEEIPDAWDLPNHLDYRDGDTLTLFHRLDGHERKYTYKRYSLGGNVGISGDFSNRQDWKWSINNNTATYKEKDTYSNRLLLAESKNVFIENRYNPFVGLNFSDVADEVFYDAKTSTEYFLNVLSYNMDGPLYEGDKKKLFMAVGLEYGYHRYKEVGDHQAINGNLLNFQGLTSSDNRTNRSAYAELGFDYSHWFSSQATARIDNFSNFKTMTSPKLAMQVRPQEDISLRASVSRGYKLPELAESKGGHTLNAYYGLVDSVECEKYKNTEDEVNRDKYCSFDYYPVTAESNPDIEEEKVRSWNVGMTYTPTQKLTLAADYWNYTIENVLGAAPIQHFLKLQSKGGNPNMADYGISEISRDANGDPDIDQIRMATLFNIGTQVKKGVDVKAKYDFHSRSSLNFVYSRMLEDKYTLDSFVDSELGNYGYPRYRYKMAWDYTFPEKKKRLWLERNTVGKYKNYYETGTIPEHSQYNAAYRHRLNKGELVFKVENLLDSYPDYDKTQDVYFDTSLYSVERSYGLQYKLAF